MAANIQWDLYAGHCRHLVRMFDNEKEIAFRASCHPITRGSYFYDLVEMQRCYSIQ